MSVPLYTPQQIHDWTINNSQSKQMYSFGKEERFPKMKRNTDSFYTLPSTKMNRTAGIGYGTKSDFTKKPGQKGITAGFYSILRDYDDYPAHMRGHSFRFGPGRNEVRINGEAYGKKVPGPGNYGIAPRYKFGNGGPQFALKGKLSYDYSVKRQKGMPGPGTYNPIININKEGKYASSKIRNMRVFSFGSPNDDRFKVRDNKVPGPCYTMPSTLGRQYNSRYINDRYTYLSGRIKYPGSKDNYPGPGSYLPFSEFGILVSKSSITAKNRKNKKNGLKKKEKNEEEKNNKTVENDDKNQNDDTEKKNEETI